MFLGVRWAFRWGDLLSTLPMNINGYILLLLNTLDTIASGGTYANCFGGGVSPRIHVMQSTHLEPQGVVPQALTLLGEARFIYLFPEVLLFREYRLSLRHFWSHQACLSKGPAPRPTFKRHCAKLVRLEGRTTNRENILSSHLYQRLPSSRRWKVLYFLNVIKISISFPTSVLINSHSVTYLSDYNISRESRQDKKIFSWILICRQFYLGLTSDVIRGQWEQSGYNI